MNQQILPVAVGNLPQGYCPTSYQDLANAISAAQSVTITNQFSGVYVSTTPPTDQTQYWVKIDSQGRKVAGFIYAQGAWLAPHSLLPGMIIIVATAFTATTIQTYDGGDTNAAGPYSGPMWQFPVDGAGNSILNGQFPLGAGTLQDGTTVIAAGTAGGEQNHTLLTQEVPAHRHNYGIDPVVNTSATYITAGQSYKLSDPQNVDNGTYLEKTSTGLTGGDGTTANNTVPHNNMPPYYGVTFLQRTNRLFYKGA